MNYDIIVIGAGSAGLNIASFMNAIKLKVLFVEKHLIGGDCLNYGCVPSKSLIHLSKLAHSAKESQKIGFKIGGRADIKKVSNLIKQRQEVIRKHENPDHFRRKGIDVIIGEARFASKNSIIVNKKEYSARKTVIATGSRPRIPQIPGIEKIKYHTNETVFSNKILPGKLLVIGGGPIGIEIAQSYQRLGSEVTVVTQDNQIVPKEEKEIADELMKILVKEGIDVKLDMRPVKFVNMDAVVIQKFDKKKNKFFGNKVKLNFNQVLIATGRVTNIDDLDLEKAGIKTENGRLILDDCLRTTNKKIYACGDATGDFQFTHWAEYQASVIIKNLLHPLKTHVNKDLVAWVTYTDPELATFGLRLQEIKQKAINFKKISIELKEVDRAICEGINHGKLNLYLSDGKIIGGTMLAKNAGELVGELITAMTLGIPLDKLFNRVYPYPTMARINRKAAQSYLSEKLTPRTIRVLRSLYRILN